VNFTEKLDAILDVTSSCEALNGRTDMIYNLQQLIKNRPNGTLELHSYGKCNRNVPEEEAKKLEPGPAAKIALARKYKFCLVRAAPGLGGWRREVVLLVGAEC
jgi:hypothetical protein